MKRKYLQKTYWLMKTSLFGLILNLIAFSLLLANEGNAQQAPNIKDVYVSIDMEDVSLGEIFKVIENKTSYKFSFERDDLRKKDLFTIQRNSISIKKLLYQLSRDSGLNFKQINWVINVSENDKIDVNSISRTEILSQGINITGKVVSSEDGEELPGVNVLVKETSLGTVTDLDGNYSITVPSEESILVFSSVGYTSEEIVVGTRAVIDLSLIPDIQALQEIVVTALGVEREKKSLGYSVTEVNGAEVKETNMVSPIAALQGKVAGLSIGGGDGGTFGGNKISIRGQSTLGSNNQPIFVVDGIILDNDLSGDTEWNSSSADYGNELKNLNSDDFESVSVLKGAAATALYGSRGINGAIVITTKSASGKKGLGISISQTVGIDYVYDTPDLQNEFGEGTLAGYVNYGETDNNGSYYSFDTRQFYTKDIDGTEMGSLIHPWAGFSFGPRFDGRTIEDYDHTLTTYDAVPNNMKDAYDLGFNTNTNITIQGGTEKTSAIFSLSQNNRKGYFPRNDFSRSSILLKADTWLSDRIRLSGSVAFTQSNPRNPATNLAGLFPEGNVSRSYDTKKYKQKDMYTADHGGVPNNDYNDELGDVPATSTWFSIYNNTYDRKETTIRPTVSLTADVTEWFNVTLEGNMNYYMIKYEAKELGQGYANVGGYYEIEHYAKTQKTGKLLLNFNKTFGDISTSFTTGGEIFQTDASKSNVKTNGGLIVPGQYFIGNSLNTVQYDGDVGISDTKQINSLYFFLNLGWKNQLFLDITGRNDWSSTLVYANGSGNYSYFYPSASSSWLFTETFSLPSWFSTGRLRASYAQVGNDADPYSINSAYNVESMIQSSGYAYRNRYDLSLIDPNLKPEKKNAIEFGGELGFINDRLGLDFTWYKENTINQIIDIPAPEASGVTSQKINAGDIQNMGVEVALRATPVATADFRWNLTFNYWKNQNKIISLHEDVGEYKSLSGSPDYGNYRIGTVAWIGGEYGELLSDILPAVNENGDKILTWSNSRRGAYYQRSGEIQRIGNINPDFEGSVSNDFSYKGFNLGFLIDMRFGGYLASYNNRYGTAYGYMETSTKGLDADHGGITWVSGHDGRTYYDGVIPEGVFADGTTITQPNGDSQDVGGMTYEQAYEAGYVEPTHASYYTYFTNSWGQGVINDDWFSEINYVSLRQVMLGYTFSRSFTERLKIENLNISLVGRNLVYLYNSLPNHLNPESTRGNSSSYSYFERTFTPFVASYAMTVKFDF
jgi:iron complex outermembrane receptor protein